MPVIVPGHESITQAAETLRGGGVVAFPTETVYGLGADTFNENAIRLIYKLKGRPFDNPLIAHVHDEGYVAKLAARWDDRCHRLAQHFWPGPLTIIVPKAKNVPEAATAGYPTIALRSPSHFVARELLRALGGPISAPSANRSGHVSPTRAAHVAADFADADDLLILDGGACELGIESTVLDMSGAPRILRPGSVTMDAIRAAINEDVSFVDVSAQMQSPGTSPAHYAPRTKAELVDRIALEQRLAAATSPIAALVMQDVEAGAHSVFIMPQDAELYASRLYDAMREADSCGASAIVIERPTRHGAMWDAIRNRLSRAAEHPTG